MKYDNFVSSSFNDRVWVHALAKALKDHGLTVWYDKVEIRPGDLFLDRLREGLDESRNIVFVLGENAAKSNWIAAELGAALAPRRPIIPVVPDGVRPADLPGPIRRRRSITKREPSETAEEIARATSPKSEEEEA